MALLHTSMMILEYSCKASSSKNFSEIHIKKLELILKYNLFSEIKSIKEKIEFPLTQ